MRKGLIPCRKDERTGKGTSANERTVDEGSLEGTGKNLFLVVEECLYAFVLQFAYYAGKYGCCIPVVLFKMEETVSYMQVK